MNDIQILSIIYGAAGILGSGYLCIAMSSGLIAQRHHGHGARHHGTGHGVYGSGHGHHGHAGADGSHGSHTGSAGSHHRTGHSGHDASGHHSAGHHGSDAGAAHSLGHSQATGQAASGFFGKRVLGQIEHSAHMHLPHFHTQRIWPVVVDYFNPTSVAIMLSMGGMVGFLCLQINSFPKLLSLPCAIMIGLIARKVFFNLLEKFSEVATVSTALNTETAIGGEATVCLPISEGRTGEVFYEIGGKRYNSSARAHNGSASFVRGQKVWVTDIKEGVFIVMDVTTIDSNPI